MKLVGIETSSQTYYEILKEGKSKGFDLPYEDEAVQLLNVLYKENQTLADKAINYLATPEKNRLILLNKNGITGASDDYYDLLLIRVCIPIVKEEVRRLKDRLKFINKLDTK